MSLTHVTDPPPVIPADALIDRRSGKPRRIPKAIRRAIELIRSGEVTTIKAAAERVSMNADYLGRALTTPHIQAFLARKARENIATGALRASARVVELMDAASEHVSLDASKHVLAIEGIKPDERGTNININNNVAGYVINLAPGERVREALVPVEPKPLSDNKGEGNGT